MNTPNLLHSLLSLLLAGFWAALLAAFRETGNAGVARLAEKEPKAKERLERWEPRWNLLCTTLRFCLTLFEIAAVYFAVQAVNLRTPWQAAGLILGMTLLYIVFIRVIPFVLAESYADRLSLRFLPLAILLTRVLTPLVWPLYAIERGLLSHALTRFDDEDRPSAEEEIMTLVEQADEKDIEEEERDIIRSVFEFGETVAREIMTPRVDIEALGAGATVAECVEKLQHSRHSRFPVYQKTIDEVCGLLHVKDLLQLTACGQSDTPVSTVMKKLPMVPETMPINDLLRQMQCQNLQVVLVVDEYGGTAGLVSMEDIIEELVGEIRDEYDLAEKDIQKRSDGSILVNATLTVANLNEELDLEIPESDEYDSIGGFVLNELGHIPRAGIAVSAPGLEIIVQHASARRIHTLLLKHAPKTEKA